MVRYFVAAVKEKDEELEKKNVRIEGLIRDFQSHIEICNTNFIKNSQQVVKVTTQHSRTIEKMNLLITGQTDMIQKLLTASTVAEDASKFMREVREGKLHLETVVKK